MYFAKSNMRESVIDYLHHTPHTTHHTPHTTHHTPHTRKGINRRPPENGYQLIIMYNRRRRACPICGKPNLLWPSHHLRQVHGLSSEERQRWLPRVSHLPPTVDPVHLPPSSGPVIPVNNSPLPCLMDNTLETLPHPEFAFQHPYSMIVVGPSQCGKTHFVHQLLTHKCTVYPSKKSVLVCWCYNQWQPQYEDIRRDLGSNIRFCQGIPELEEDLSEIKTSKHTIMVLDDLMDEAKDSPVVSKLFTQGRHRNASVILLLQNMFPKGKYNTDISRNATYKVLFRSPGDRKQIDIMAEQTFAKDRPRFMQAYHRETDQPYGYIVVDNHPRTTSERQVVANVLGDCYTYPHITSTSPPSYARVEPLPPPEKPVTVTRKRKAVQKALVINQSSSKRVRKRPAPFIKAKKRKVPVKKRKPKRKQPVHDSTDEEDMEEGEEGGDGEITSEGEDSEISYTEGEDNEPVNEEEEEENQNGGTWRYLRPPKGGGGRTVYEDGDDVSPEQARLKHAFYNPHLYHPMRCGYRAGGFGPRSLSY